MTILEQILERYPDNEIVKADGLDGAVISIWDNPHNGGIKLVYSISKAISILAKDMTPDEDAEMTAEDVAKEYFYFNCIYGDVIWVEDDYYQD